MAVAPDLYIAFGIPGTMQHRARMTFARRITIVNSNPNAPNRFADLNLIADASDMFREMDRSP